MRTTPRLGAVVLALGLVFGASWGVGPVHGDVWDVAALADAGKFGEAESALRALDETSREMAMEFLRPEPLAPGGTPDAAQIAKAWFLFKLSTSAGDLLHVARALPEGAVTDEMIAAAVPAEQSKYLLLRILNLVAGKRATPRPAVLALEEWSKASPSDEDLRFLRNEPLLAGNLSLQATLQRLSLARGQGTGQDMAVHFSGLVMGKKYDEAIDYWVENCGILLAGGYENRQGRLAFELLQMKDTERAEKVIRACPPSPEHATRWYWLSYDIHLHVLKGDRDRAGTAILQALDEAARLAPRSRTEYDALPHEIAWIAASNQQGEWLEALLASPAAAGANPYTRATRIMLASQLKDQELLFARLAEIDPKDFETRLKNRVLNLGTSEFEKAGRLEEALRMVQRFGDPLDIRLPRYFARLERYGDLAGFLRQPAVTHTVRAAILREAFPVLVEQKRWDLILDWSEDHARSFDKDKNQAFAHDVMATRLQALAESGRADEAVGQYFQLLLPVMTNAPLPMQAIRHVQAAPGFPAALDAFLQAHAAEPSPPLGCHQAYVLSTAALSEEQLMSLGMAMLRADTRHYACNHAMEAIRRKMPGKDMMDLLDAFKAKDPSQTQRWERSELTQLNQMRFTGDIEGAKAYLDRVGQNPSRVSAQLLGEIAYLRHTPGLREDVAGFFLAALLEAKDPAMRPLYFEYWLHARQDGDHPEWVDSYLAEDFPRMLGAGDVPGPDMLGTLLAHAKAKGSTDGVLQAIRENHGAIAKADLLQRLSQAVRKTDPALGLLLIEKAWSLEKKTTVLRSFVDALVAMQRHADIVGLLATDVLPGDDWQRDLLPKRIQALAGLKEWERTAEESMDFDRRFPADKQRLLQKIFETLVKEGQYEAAEPLFVRLAPSLETVAKDDARRAGLLLKAAILYQALDDGGPMMKSVDGLMANTRFGRGECDALAKVLADFTRHRPEVGELPADDWTRRMRESKTESPDKERFLAIVAHFNETGVWVKDPKKK